MEPSPFQAQDVHREALAALALFQEATHQIGSRASGPWRSRTICARRGRSRVCSLFGERPGINAQAESLSRNNSGEIELPPAHRAGQADHLGYNSKKPMTEPGDVVSWQAPRAEPSKDDFKAPLTGRHYTTGFGSWRK